MTAISTSNLLWYLSGGAGNSNPVASLGGVISSTQWSTATALDDLFPDVTGAQAASGITQYLCLYFKNTDPTVNGLIAAGVYVLTQVMPTDANDKIAVALGTSAKNATEQTIGTITTAPSGVSWIDASTAVSMATGAQLPTPMVQNDTQAVWFRRTIGAGAAASGAVYTASAVSTTGSPATVTCGANIPTGTTVTLAGFTTTPTSVNGTWTATNVSGTQFSIVANVTTDTTNGTVTVPSGCFIAVGGDTTG